jgi:CTP:molybdopterin cytidylyltransferase MocA
MLQGLAGDKGARHFLRERESEVAAVEMPAAAVDVDLPGDLEQSEPANCGDCN